jgi:DNA-binding MarR family transcriptional regulator
MINDDLLQCAMERFWDTVPPVWGRVRGNARSSAIHKFKINLVQFHILRHIRKGAHSASELAEQLQTSRPAISQAVEVLVKKGLVTRREDPTDRRFTQLSLTDSGSDLLTYVFGESRQWMAEKMTALSPSDLETIIHAMDILKKTFDNPEE